MALTIRGSQDSRWRWTESLTVLCVCVAAAGAYAVYIGQDWGWDQRNYHVYAVYAWLNGTILSNLAPGQIQTWLNPAPHLLQYLLIRHASPMVAGAGMGAMAGVNGLLLWILVRRLQGHDPRRLARLSAALVVALGLTGSLFLSFLGTTAAEYLCSLLVLASLICLTATDRVELGPRRFLLAGFWVGAACGLKLTNLIYALGLSTTLVLLWPFFRFRVLALLSYGVGGMAGFVLVGGYWATKLWLAFRNPMFPFFNGLFESPWFEPANFADRRFLPKSLLYALVTYPFDWLLGIFPTSELPFREPRFAYVAALLPLAVVVLVARSREVRPGGNAPDTAVGVQNFALYVLFFVASFVIWIKQFGIQRYGLPLELMTGVVVFLCLTRVLRGPGETTTVLGLLLLFAVLWTRPPDWEHTSYGQSWYGIEPPPHPGGPTMYILVSWRPISYAIPFLPKEDQFVRLDGNLPLEPGMPLGQRALRMIRAHTGPIRTLTLDPIDTRERARLDRFGLRLQDDSCTIFRSRVDVFRTCAVTKVGNAGSR